jgi:anti-anti-sigma regulatory factor
MDAAVVIMRSDFAILHRLDDDHGELRSVAFRGPPSIAEAWRVLKVGRRGPCGSVLKDGERLVIVDVEADPAVMDSEDEDLFHRSGIRSCQVTPLRARSGRMIGLLSTHWIEVHRPMVHDLVSLDVLARQAADLIQHLDEEEQRTRLLRSLEAERRLVLKLSAPILRIRERLLLLPLIGLIDRERARLIGDALLAAVRKERACVSVIEVSGVAAIDGWVADWLADTVQAARLLGSAVVLTGVTPRLAPCLMPLAFGRGLVTIAGDLQEGIQTALARLR